MKLNCNISGWVWLGSFVCKKKKSQKKLDVICMVVFFFFLIWQFPIWNIFVALFSLWVLQGKLDALWALFRRGYDQVSLMRPQPGDQVSLPLNYNDISFLASLKTYLENPQLNQKQAKSQIQNYNLVMLMMIRDCSVGNNYLKWFK